MHMRARGITKRARINIHGIYSRTIYCSICARAVKGINAGVLSLVFSPLAIKNDMVYTIKVAMVPSNPDLACAQVRVLHSI